MKTVQDMIDLGYEERGHPDGTRLVHVASGYSYVVAGTGTGAEVSEDVYAEASNRKAMWDKLVQARDFFGSNFTGWASLTAQQKDAANRQAQRALANIARTLINDLSTSGD